MEFGILGPLQITSEDRTVLLGGTKPRALLALMLVHTNESLSSHLLIDQLWQECPPASASTTLQTYVSQLRKQLGADVVRTIGSGYRLHVEGDALDALRFQRTLDEITAAVDATPTFVVERLRAALSLWRGAALGEFLGAPWADPEAARLEELRLVALEELCDARLDLGEHARLVAELESLVASNPLRERLWGQLLLALYRCDRQADALRTYQRLRRRLGEELGIEPSRELARLEQAILLQDRDLDWRPTNSDEARRATPPDHEPEVELPTGVVTFMLTDIVGSTELWETHRSAMSAAVASYVLLVDDTVGAHNGRLVKQRGEGDSTFCVFERATDAVAAAIDAQDAFASFSWPDAIPLTVRTALHTGEAIERDGDYYGTTVNRAARLRELAAPGAVVLSQATTELVVDHLPPGCGVTELGARKLRGLRRDEHVYSIAPHRRELLGDRSARAAAGMPLPAALASDEVFVGRDAALIQLDEAWHTMKKVARPAAVFVSGEPGIGKTRLVAELARRLHSDGATILFGRCDEDLGVAFQPFTEALRQYVRSVPPARLRSLVARELRGQLRRLVPEFGSEPLDPAPPSTDAETERYELFEAVRAFFGVVSTESPLLLVLDDVHWAAKPTLLLLRHLLRASEPMSMLVVATYRDTELVAINPFTEALPDLRAGLNVAEVILSGLNVEDVSDYLQASGRTAADTDALAEQLWRDTDGLPLFVHELTRQFDEATTNDLRAGAARHHVPARVQDVIGHRIDRLSPMTRSLLAAAAVVGPSCAVDFLERLATAEAGDDFLDAIDEAITSGILVDLHDDTDALVFTHALVREVAYSRLTTPRRTRLHRRVAEVLESLGGVGDDDERLPALAHHWAQAGPSFVNAAVDYALRAGRQALNRLAFEETLGYLKRGIEILDNAASTDHERRADLLLLASEAHRSLSNLDEMRDVAERAANEARAAGSSERLAAAAARRASYSDAARTDSAAVELCREALAAIGDEHPALRATLLAAIAFHQAWAESRGLAAAPLAEEALQLARESGNYEALVGSLSVLGLALLASERVADRLQLNEELIAETERAGDNQWRATGLHLRAVNQLIIGDISGFDADLAELRRLTTKTSGRDRAYVAMLGALRALIDGRFDDAETSTGEILLHGGDYPDFFNAYAAQLLFIRREQGRLREILDVVVQAVEDNPSMQSFRAALALVYCDVHRQAEARRHFESLVSEELSATSRDAMWTVSLAMLAEVGTVLDDRAHASMLYELLRPHTGHLVVAAVGLACLGAVDRYLGMLARVLERWDDAEEHFRSALALEQRLGSRPLMARTGIWFARMLIARGRAADHQEAAQVLAAVFADAEDLQMASLATEAGALHPR